MQLYVAGLYCTKLGLPSCHAGFLMIPLAQEGIRAATLFVLMTILTGPGAAVAFYFWWREGKYSEKYSSSERPWLHQFVSQIDWLVAEA